MRSKPLLDRTLTLGAPLDSRAWTARGIDRTFDLPHRRGDCGLEIDCVLPAGPIRLERPHEATLDRIVGRLLAALGGTVLRGERILGDGGEIVARRARKPPARADEATGIRLVVRPPGRRPPRARRNRTRSGLVGI